MQQLDSDIDEIQKSIKQDKDTIYVLKDRLELAEDSLKNDKKLLENKKTLKAKKSEQQVIIEDSSSNSLAITKESTKAKTKIEK